MKKLTCVIMVTFFLAVNVRAVGTYNGGDGSGGNPYRISAPADMQEIGVNQDDLDKYFVLTNDIDLGQFKGSEFNLIGGYYNDECSLPFSGVFDGCGHSISNFTYQTNDACSNKGLFAAVYGGTGKGIIKNLTLIDPNVTIPEGGGVGGLVGFLWQGYIWNCSVKGAVVCGYDNVGGLLGVAKEGTINKSKVTDGTVSGIYRVGGLAGICEDLLSNINNCSAICSVSGFCGTGGLVGNTGSSLISNSFAGGQVWGTESVGGLIGLNGGQLNCCYSMANVAGDYAIGGLIGWQENGDVIDCYAAGMVDGNDGTGGFAGVCDYPFYTNCFWDNSINPSLDGIGNISDPNVIGKTKAEMSEQGTFTGWDFVNTWGIAENQTYPYLRPSIASDLNGDQVVNLLDMAEMANNWLYSSPWAKLGYQTVAEAIEIMEVNIKTLNQIKSKVTEMGELASQSATGAYSAEQREEMNGEFGQLRLDIDNISRNTRYRGIRMLTSGTSWFGINTGKGYLEIYKINATVAGLGLLEADISTIEGAQAIIEVLNNDLALLNTVIDDYKSKEDLLREILKSF